MRYFLFLLLIVSLSPSLQAQETSAFIPLGTAYSPRLGTELIIPNMPRYRDQDTLGICYGFSSSVVAQHWYCQKQNLDCTKLTPQQTISPLSTTGWANLSSPDQDRKSLDSHRNITNEAGHGSIALFNAAESFRFAAEACAEFDKVANEYSANSTANRSKFLETYQRIETHYKSNKTTGAACIDCLSQDLNCAFKVKIPTDEIQKALKLNSFPEFLYQVFFQYCKDEVQLPADKRPRFASYPKNAKVDLISKTDYSNKIKEILSKGLPINIDGICYKTTNGVCAGKHSVVVSGFRQACKADGTCRDTFKIQNSWGKDWQDKNNDGWIDADNLISSISLTANSTLSWYQ